MTPDAIDITIACILLLSGVVAYVRGIIREAFTIVALIAATTAAWLGGGLMTPPFRKWLHVKPGVGDQAAHAVSKAAAHGTDASVVKSQLFMGVIAPEKAAVIFSYLSVFIFIYLVMTLVGFFLTRAVNESGLSIVDRILGGGFGLARGFLLVFMFYMPVHLMVSYDKYPQWATSSVSIPILEKAAVYADKHLDLAKFIEDKGDKLVVKLKKPTDDNKDKKEDGQANEDNGAASDSGAQDNRFHDYNGADNYDDRTAGGHSNDNAPAPVENHGLSDEEMNRMPQTGDLP
ncbi:MAG: hypothetical protein GC185_03095 [Alphaproteobacteria bacterium]|nr:hypothetical protein [Alphaproteobacteria bacterium]